jgi:hypothetical protein
MAIEKEHTIKDIDQHDSEWIVYNLKQLRMFLENISGQKLSEISSPVTLDEYFQLALNGLHSGELAENDIVTMFGVGFGQYLEEKTDYYWVVFSDKYGTDLALKNLNNGNIVFPISSTRKRIRDNTAGTFDSIYITLTANV